MIDEDTNSDIGRFAAIFIAYAALCIVSAIAVGSPQTKLIEGTIPAGGGQSETFRIAEANSVISIEIKQQLPSVSSGEYSTWVQTSLVDDVGRTLISLSGDVWTAGGYASDGPWRERKLRFDGPLTIQAPGSYSLDFDMESSLPETAKGAGPVRYSVRPQRGSPVLLYWLGGPSLALGLMLGWAWISNLMRANDLGIE